MPDPLSTGISTTDRSIIRTAVVQYELRPIPNFEAFAKQCYLFVKTAAAYKADFLLFPELFTTQLLSFLDVPDGVLAANRLAEMLPQYETLFAELARSSDLNIIGGSTLCQENNRFYNVSYLFHRDGRIDKQYKIHITPAERKAWDVEPGHEVNVVETDRGRVAILICYDIEFPELSRIAVSEGANIIFVPSNTDQRQGYLRVRYCAQARCIENQIYVALSGCTGNLPMLESGEIHYSQSAIFTPSDIAFSRDAIAAECAPNVETMIIHDLDLRLLHENRESGSVRPWRDRRTDLYAVHYKQPENTTTVR